MKRRYFELTENIYCTPVYDLYMKEECRTIITRWRLSCHDLQIQTGRYTDVAREERLCSLCDVVEDEQHVVFECRAYSSIREQFSTLITENPRIRDILNPRDGDTAGQVGELLKLIEEKRRDIFWIQISESFSLVCLGNDPTCSCRVVVLWAEKTNNC